MAPATLQPKNKQVNGTHAYHDLRPNSPGPLANDFARQQVTKQQRNNYHSSSLRAMNVNQTSLHPAGVA